jgi:alpha-1,6-mannosyltransferase
MKIVQVANFVHETSGGMRTALSALQRQYLLQGHEVVQIRPGAEARREEIDSVLQIVVRGPVLPMTGGYRVIMARRGLQSILTELKPDVVELSDKSTLSWLPHWCQGQGIACIVISHERTDLMVKSLGWQRFIVEPIVKHYRSLVTRNADAIVCASEFAAQEFGTETKKVRIVPLGVELGNFSAAAKERQWGTPLTLVVCARLSREKNIDIAIESIRLLSTVRPCQLLIMGDGPLMGQLQQQASGLPVHFFGHVASRESIANILTFADVMLNLGNVETFGLASLEALASGTPVVSANTGAAKEIVNNLCGRITSLVPQQIVDAICELTEQSRVDLTEQCRTRAEAFDWAFTGKQMEEMYLSLSPRGNYVSHS